MFRSAAPSWLALAALSLLVLPAAAQRGDAPVVRKPSLPGGNPSALGPVPREAIARTDVLPGSTERPAILLTGYWPPSNEAVRQFSTNPTQNPGGWQGGDWEGRGYDVHAFFPEFTPPACTFCGKGSGDLEVDYQDTSADFWPIAESLEPIAVITFSRGFPNKSWEVEMNQFNKPTWFDDFLAPVQPTPAPPDSSVPANHLRPSTLPVNEIVAAVAAAGLGLNPFVCWTQDGGGFLSEFIAYHGVWYQSQHLSPADPAWCVAAGHVHVGGQIDWMTAELAVEVTLRAVIQHVDAVVGATVCQTDLGFAGPGASTLAVCGAPLTAGATADLLLSGAPPGSPAFLLAGFASNPTPVLGGTVVPYPPPIVVPATTDGDGELAATITGPGIATRIYAQAAVLDASAVFGVGFSNALAVDFLP